MEKNEISAQEVSVWNVFKSNPNKWLSNKEIQGLSENVALRTIRAYTLKMVKLGLIDVAEVFPSHRYQISEKHSKRNTGYSLRLEKASEVFGYKNGKKK